VNWFRGIAADETILSIQETALSAREKVRKRTPVSMFENDQQWGSVMSIFLTFIYREYCKARLAEMQTEGHAALNSGMPEASAS
jgi:hypothetical protein